MTEPLGPRGDTGTQPPAWEQGEPGAVEQPRSYWATADTGASVFGSSLAVVAAGAVLMIFGVLLTLGGAVALLGGGALDAVLPQTPEGRNIRSLITAVSVVVLILGILQIATAVGIWRHRSWARMLGIVIAALLLVMGILGLMGSLGGAGTGTATGTADASSAIVSSLVGVIAYGFTLLALVLGGRHFELHRMG